MTESGVRGSEYIAKWLKAQGINWVFELSGGMIMQILDSIHLEGGIEIVTVHHEQTAGFAAEAIGKLSGRPGVAIATSGPGAINLLNGVASAYFDSAPAIYLTGQVNRHERKGDKAIRQLGFQETDVISMVGPITKHARAIAEPCELASALDEAFQIATSGRPGSVLVDIPMDISRSVIPGEPTATRLEPEPGPAPTGEAVQAFVQARKLASKPLILAGGGVRAAGASKKLRQVAEALQIPVVWSLMGVDLLPSDHPLNVGMIGTYGNRWANKSLASADLLLVVGSRLDIRQTGADAASFKGDRPIFHVDIEAAEINNRVTGCTPIVANVDRFFDAVLAAVGSTVIDPPTSWIQTIDDLRLRHPDIDELKDVEGINPNQLMRALSKDAPTAVYAVDVGQHQMWAAQSIRISEGQRFITSGGLGSMGYALPAAIGAAIYHNKQKPVMVIAGDAGFQLNIQDLQTVRRNSLPIKMVVVNNRCHGMTRQFQDTYFGGRYQSTIWGYDTPDFAEVAVAYGIAAAEVSDPEELPARIARLWRDPLEPYLLEVRINTFANAYPKLAFGLPISEMEPDANPIAMEGT